MANPNIVNVTTINGVTTGMSVTTTAISTQDATTSNAIAHNAASSGKVFKINALYVSNSDTTNAVDISVAISNNTNVFHIAKTISLPADATLDVLSKPIYLMEGWGLYLSRGATAAAEAVVSYEEIS